jgi:uncharacterized protein
MMPISILIKPASGNCNMRCKYCFYADEQEKREVFSYGMMTFETLQRIVDQAIEVAGGSCTFAFQGGEPTLRGLDFYRDFVAYVKERTRSSRLKIYYSLQTNGYCMDDDWARFFAENHFLIGISLDGTKEIHDRYRLDAAGKGTYNRVMAAIRLLEKYHVEYNILTVVTAATARNAQRIYHFFKKNHLKYQQYIECLDPLGEAHGTREYSLTPERYEQFLKNLFDAWYLDWKQGTYVYNRYFENLLLIMNGQAPESCNMCGQCSQQWVIEADGSVYPCDFYALDAWRLGNIMTDDFERMNRKREELGFVAQSRLIPDTCRSCKWYALCRNGCRRLREPVADGEAGTNYFCGAYKNFFEYAYDRLVEVYRA